MSNDQSLFANHPRQKKPRFIFELIEETTANFLQSTDTPTTITTISSQQGKNSFLEIMKETTTNFLQSPDNSTTISSSQETNSLSKIIVICLVALPILSYFIYKIINLLNNKKKKFKYPLTGMS